MEMESRRKPFTKINKFMDSEKTQDHNIEKKCWKCGASLATDAKFCPACLADVSVSGVSNDPIVPITFKDLINILKTKLQTKFPDPSERGKKSLESGKEFEKICKFFLENDSHFSEKFEMVWLFNEWPGRRSIDIGIDLVAQEKNGDLCAVQAKYHSNTVPSEEIDKFIAAAADRSFKSLLLISMSDITHNSDFKLQNNSKHSDFVQRDRLESSDANWAKYLDLNQKTFKLGGKIERLAAFIIDELIAIICLLPLGTTFFSALGTNDQEMMMNAISGKLEMVLFLTFVPIIIQAYLVTTRGQSIGKIVMSLRIVNAKDGTNPGFLKAFFVRRILPAPLFFLPPILLLYSVVNVLFIFRSDRRCIHDWIGRTIVVESKIDKLEKKDK
ncbi:MAG: RDD family protein [Dehalococcoidia bacterium]|jgi:uncharacterized RDD family membrane protein YckC|nr:RDD family protein [Dehalococcoidia bacterium]